MLTVLLPGWLSGIFRDVWLHSFPLIRIEDYHIQTLLDDDFEDAWLNLEVQLNIANIPMEAKLLDGDGKILFKEVHTSKETSLTCKHRIKSPRKWTAETPYLYTLVLSVGKVHAAQKVGFRRAELIDGVFCVNGNPVKLRGVNRHEHHP
jgi:beta-galactosidase